MGLHIAVVAVLQTVLFDTYWMRVAFALYKKSTFTHAFLEEVRRNAYLEKTHRFSRDTQAQ